MKVILFGAGGPAGVNFARACARDREISIIGLDSEHRNREGMPCLEAVGYA